MSGVIGMPVDEYMKIIDKLHKMRKLRELMKKDDHNNCKYKYCYQCRYQVCTNIDRNKNCKSIEGIDFLLWKLANGKMKSNL